MQHTSHASRSTAGDSIAERLFARPYFRQLISKTSAEIFLLALFIGGITIFSLRHPYYQITDIRIDGVDTYAREHVEQALREAMNIQTFGVNSKNYLLFRPQELEKRIRASLVVDALSIEQRFPHTVVIHCTEREMALRVVADDGSAMIASDGQLVRWYATTTRESDIPNRPAIKISGSILSHKLGDSVLSTERASLLEQTFKIFENIQGHHIIDIIYDTQSESGSIELDSGLVMVIRQDAHIETQFEKARLGLIKYPLAKKIDVRFGDKIFVSF